MSANTVFWRVPKRSLLGMAALAAALTFIVPSDAPAQSSSEPVKITASSIGRPPIFSATFVDVGQEMGFFKAAGADVTFRWFQRGSDTAKSAVTGDVALGFTSSQAALNLIAAGAPVIAVAGMPNQDWVVASSDPSVKGCKDLKGKTVTADGINNARTLYLEAYLKTCEVPLNELKLLDLANAPLVKAAIAAQVNSGVFHIDELAQVEFKTGKKWTHLDVPPEIQKALHYVMLIASKKAIEENKEGIIRFLEGWILTQNMMSSPAASDKAAFATVAANASQIDFQVALSAINDYQKISYWVNNDGLDEGQIQSQLDQLVKIGSVKGERPGMDKIVDRSLYAEAKKRVEAKFGKLN